MNKVFLSGNLTRDPEVRYSQSGKAFSRMGIAINRRYKDQEQTDFFNLVACDNTAEFCGKYFRKGSRVLVEGRLKSSSYENKDGVKVNTVDIWIDNIEFADSKRQSGGDDENYSGRSNNYSERREPAPSRKNDDYFGGEPIDPEDTPF
ncbi:MAG: single-stranded DNA-binding protein [Selenomonadaceae bacterium]|nr:single-stranded DNA-binding protein [Selenomonadaceae bacterium]